MNNKVSDVHNSAIKIFVAQLVIMACKNMLTESISFLSKWNAVLNFGIMIIFILLYLYLFIIKKYITFVPTKTYCVLVLLLSFVIITFIISPTRFLSTEFPYSYVRSQSKTFLIYCLPSFVIVSSLYKGEGDFQQLEKKLYKSTTSLFIVASIAFLSKYFLKTNNSEYSMSYSNAVMFLSILLLFRYKKERKFIYIVEFLITLVYIIASGARNPLISIALVMIYILYSNNNPWYMKVLSCIMSLIFILFIINYEYFINQIYIIFTSIGIESRTIRLLISENVFYDSGRSEIVKILIEKINEHSILGLGAFGGEATVGLSHHLYYDIFANFGYIFGSSLLLIILINIINIIVHDHNNSICNLMIMMCIIVFPRGFVVQDFWTTKELWILFGIFISYNKKIKNTNLKVHNVSGV